MDSMAGVLAIVFTFVLAVVVVNRVFDLLKVRAQNKKERDNAQEQQKRDSSQMSRAELLRELEKLNERIENMDIIIKEREKNGN